MSTFFLVEKLLGRCNSAYAFSLSAKSAHVCFYFVLQSLQSSTISTSLAPMKFNGYSGLIVIVRQKRSWALLMLMEDQKYLDENIDLLGKSSHG